jgi:hypothetical protein
MKRNPAEAGWNEFVFYRQNCNTFHHFYSQAIQHSCSLRITSISDIEKKLTGKIRAYLLKIYSLAERCALAHSPLKSVEGGQDGH